MIHHMIRWIEYKINCIPESPSLRTCQLELNFEANPFNSRKPSCPLSSLLIWRGNRTPQGNVRLFLTYSIVCKLLIWKSVDVVKVTSHFRWLGLLWWNILCEIVVDVDFSASLLHGKRFTIWEKSSAVLPMSPTWDRVKIVCMPFQSFR